MSTARVSGLFYIQSRMDVDIMNGLAAWLYKETSLEAVQRLAKEAGISLLLAGILCRRGLSDPITAKRFLAPDPKDFHDPFTMDGMDSAAERIVKAIREQEKIIIHGDYDVDGITATSMLYNYLASKGAEVEFYIPNRMSEGYGISAEGVMHIKASGASLAITADCGVTAVKEIDDIRNSGIDVIVTDHHECGNVLPEAVAVINSCKPGERYPFKDLAGAGVVLKLLQAISIELGTDDFMGYLDLAALGTVADIVPLLDENRIIVKYGLDAIAETKNEGLKALLEVSGISGKTPDSWHLAFVLGPRVNAAGRISDASKAVRLFTCGDYNEAIVIARELEEENLARRNIEKEIFDEAIRKIQDEKLDYGSVIVVSGENWHRGVIGIVASRIVEQFRKPAVVISVEDGEAAGSARSVEGFNIYNALKSCSGLLSRFGGHEMAAGLTAPAEVVDRLRNALNELPAAKTIDTLKPGIRIEGYIASDDLCMERIEELERLKPFGVGNPAPVLCYEGACILEKRSVGGGRHLKMLLDCDGVETDAIAFNMEDCIENDNDGVDVAFRMELNTWGGREAIQLNLVDIKPAGRVVSEDKYYESLCRCLEYFDWEGGCLSMEKDNDCGFEIPDRIKTDIMEGKKLLFLINNLKDLHQVANFINISSNDIKKRFKICYNEFDGRTRASLVILANPLPGCFQAEEFDCVVLYGKWLDKGYLVRVAGEIDKNCAVVCSATTDASPGSDIIPDRDELALLYRYLKNNPVSLKTDDISSWVRDFSRRSGVKSNLFKVKKSLEIFKELSLVDVRDFGERGIEVQVKDNIRKKRDLMDSEVFRKLQLLKGK